MVLPQITSWEYLEMINEACPFPQIPCPQLHYPPRRTRRVDIVPGALPSSYL